MEMKVKKPVICLIVCVLVVATCWAVHYFSLPDMTVVFDHKGNAYQLDTKKIVRKKIRIDGYTNISNVTPNHDGYFCYAQNADGKHFLEVKNGTVVSSVPVPKYLSDAVFSMATFETHLLSTCTFEDVETDLINQTFVKVDFKEQKVVELSVPEDFFISDLQTNNETVLLGGYFHGKEKFHIYLYENQQLTLMTEGFHPVFISQSEFLYYDSGETKQFDLLNRKSENIQYEIDLQRHISTASFSTPKISGKWSVGFRPGIGIYESENLISRIAFCNINTGKTVSLWSTVGRKGIENIEILELKN